MKRMSVNEVSVIFEIKIPAYEKCARKDPVTELQKIRLHELGVNTTGLKCKGQATALIKALNKRDAEGLVDAFAVMLIREIGYKNRKPFKTMTQKYAFQILSLFQVLP